MSYYDFDFLSKYYPENKFYWHKKEFNKPSTGKKDAKAEEIIIMNYESQINKRSISECEEMRIEICKKAA